MIYNAQQVGSNRLIINETIPAGQNVLAVLYIPCNNNSTDINGDKKAILSVDRCNGYFIVDFEGVASFYEDLLSGEINFEYLGTWNIDLYYQESDLNTDVNQATYITRVKLQVVGNLPS